MKKGSSIVVLILVIALGFGLILGTNSFLDSVEEKEGGAVSEYNSVYPDGVEFNPIELEVENEFNEVLEVTDGSNVIGYVFDTITSGYGGDINFRIGISKEGLVQGFEPIEHNETDGFGKRMEEPEFIEGINQVNLSTGSVTFGEGNKDSGEIVAISGATVTTTAITNELVEIVNGLSSIDENITAIEKEVPYYANKWQELFKNALHIFEFEEYTGEEDIYSDNFNRIIRVKNKDGQVDSYILQLSDQGFGGNIDSLVRVSPEYRIHNIAFGEINETPNYGAYADTDEYKEYVKGINLDKNLITKAIKLLEEPKHEKDLLLISGATATSKALKSSLDAAIEGLVKFDKVKSDDNNFSPLNLDELLEASSGNEVSFDHSGFSIDESTPIENGTNDLVLQVSEAKKGGEVVGHIFDMSSEGFAGAIEFGLLVNNDGIIEEFVIYSHGETEGFGKGIEEESYQKSFIGADLNTIDNFTAGENIDAISGATYTTEAMTKAFNAVLESFKSIQ